MQMDHDTLVFSYLEEITRTPLLTWEKERKAVEEVARPRQDFYRKLLTLNCVLRGVAELAETIVDRRIPADPLIEIRGRLRNARQDAFNRVNALLPALRRLLRNNGRPHPQAIPQPPVE